MNVNNNTKVQLINTAKIQKIRKYEILYQIKQLKMTMKKRHDITKGRRFSSPAIIHSYSISNAGSKCPSSSSPERKSWTSCDVNASFAACTASLS
ncbi:IS630 transposase-related protein [Salinicoccus sediminis]|uniref:IS630 transposase-related protein n=1 Tax=Salinicoccus sediminis TaxID=1432562 RepID=UPI0012DFF5F7